MISFFVEICRIDYYTGFRAHDSFVGGFLPRADSTIGHFRDLIVRTGIWVRGGGVLVWGLFAKSELDVIYRLKERRLVVQITEEVCVRFSTDDRAPDSAACRSYGGKRADAMDGERWSAKYLTIDDEREGGNDASSNLEKG